MEVTVETINFLENIVFSHLAQQWKNEGSNGEEQILPHKLPLKRRLAEFRHGVNLTRRTSVSNQNVNNVGISAITTAVATSTTTTTTTNNGTTATGTIPNIVTNNSNSMTNSSSKLCSNLWAIERFRDITPAFVVAIFDDSIVLEPGDVGPLLFSHPVAAHLIECINRRQLSKGLLQILRKFNAPFYDGCVVVGIVDYRRWAFGGTKVEANGLMTPEMHKVLLKLSYQVLIEDIETVIREDFDMIYNPPSIISNASPKDAAKANKTPLPNLDIRKNKYITGNKQLTEEMLLEIEAKVLLATSGSLCLDPNPMVARLMNVINYDIGKFASCIRPPKYQTTVVSDAEKKKAEFKTTRIDNFLQGIGVTGRTRRQRFHLLSTLEEKRTSDEKIETEPMYGLDARKDPARLKLSSPPPLSWLGPQESLWRTMRFEQRSEHLGTRHITVHILINGRVSIGGGTSSAFAGVGKFQSIIRIGSQPCAKDFGEFRASYASKAAAEAFVEQIKQLMLVEGKLCVADVSNPNALRIVVDPVLTAANSFLSMSNNTSNTPIHINNSNQQNLSIGSINSSNTSINTDSTSNNNGAMFIPTVRPVARPSLTQSPLGGVGGGQFLANNNMNPSKSNIMMFGSSAPHTASSSAINRIIGPTGVMIKPPITTSTPLTDSISSLSSNSNNIANNTNMPPPPLSTTSSNASNKGSNLDYRTKTQFPLKK